MSTGTRYNQLPDSSIVYRAMRSSRWIDKENKKVSATAFVRREDKDENGKSKDEDGLSVYIAARCLLVEVPEKMNKCHGVAALIVGNIRDIRLDVKEDPEEYIHANITGMPYQSLNFLEAERLAGLLAKQAKIMWLPPK